MVSRTILKSIESHMSDPKAILILGPRQTGKSTLLKEIARRTDGKQLFLNCDEALSRESLQHVRSTEELRLILGDATLVLIDEAQRIQDIGVLLKLITDNFPQVKLIVSGSSAFELSNKINEPLTGRKWEYLLLPFSSQEMVEHTHFLAEKSKLHTRLIYGMYPDVVNNAGKEQEILNELANSYLYKDIFTYQDIRKPDLMPRLLKALATMIGSEITYNYLAKLLDNDHATIERYIELLEKTFIVFRLSSFSRNVRTELKKSRKIYFYDNGIRNALLSAYQPLAVRQDVGPLWENFIISERIKYLRHNRIWRNTYFWRTQQQQEIDYIEEFDGKLSAYEFKWNLIKKAHVPKTFTDAYPEAAFTVITPEQYPTFLLP
ncbi:MAG: ATP-binding protein [Lewinellaceae bacterium]|nr:ATP-binding protein [Lewinellaceae bacterium]